MSTGMQTGGGGPAPSGLADVIDTILDKGLVIDAYVRVSLIGIELVTIDARIVIASVDTYLRFAEAVNRLDISQEKEGRPGTSSGTLPETARNSSPRRAAAAGRRTEMAASPKTQKAAGSARKASSTT